MKIIINSSLNYIGGGLQVALSFIYECLKFPDNTYYVFVSSNVATKLQKQSYPNNFVFYDIPSLRFDQYDKYLSHIENMIQPDVVFSIFGPVYWRPKAPHIMGFAMGHYLYPDSPYWNIASLKEKCLWAIKKKIHFYYFQRDADAFVVETEDAANRLHNQTLKPCYVVSNTYSDNFTQFLSKIPHPKQNIILPDNMKNEYRLLSICNAYPHKNLKIISKVVDILVERGYNNIKFVLTISLKDYRKMFSDKYCANIITVGEIPPISAPQLYSECHATFVPSLLECFTANFPESMIMEKPILASDMSFSHTICGDAALYFNALDPYEIADSIIYLYHNPNLVKKIITNGIKRVSQFNTAQERAYSYLDICSKYINKSNVHF